MEGEFASIKTTDSESDAGMSGAGMSGAGVSGAGVSGAVSGAGVYESRDLVHEEADNYGTS